MGRIKIAALLFGGATVMFAGIKTLDGDESFYRTALMPSIHKLLSPEAAHNLAIFACKYNLAPNAKLANLPALKTNLFGIELENPIGIAAGFDKQGEAVEGLHRVGFGFVEIGSVTPEPQPGNPKPRVFRLIDDRAIINRYGFNSDGHVKVLARLIALKSSGNFSGVLGVNLGKNKSSDSAVDDYVQGVQKFGAIADYLVINVSSPNTPGLRQLQHRDDLKGLLSAVVEARNSLPLAKKPPILLKLAPDLSSDERKDIVAVLKRKECQIDGLIISNTTTERTGVSASVHRDEVGGLSGAPLEDKSTQMIAEMYRLTGGRMPIIGVGGIFTGNDAYRKILAGASVIQLYTSFAYYGPPIVDRIKFELNQLLAENGYTNVAQAVGKGLPK